MNPTENFLQNLPYKPTTANTGFLRNENPNFSKLTTDKYYSNTPITSSSLTPTPSLKIPEAQPTPNYSAIAEGASAGASTPSATYTTPSGSTVDVTGKVITPAKTDTGYNLEENINRLLAGTGYTQTTPISVRQQYKDLTSTPEFVDRQKRIDDLSAQLKTLQTEASAIPLQLQQDATGRGITKGGLAPIETGALRNNAIQTLSVSAQLAGEQGRLNTAINNIDKIIELTYKDQEIGIARNKTLYDRAYAVATNEQKIQLDKLKAENDAKKQQLDDLQKLKETYIKSAIDNGDYKTASAIANAKDTTELSNITSKMTGSNIDKQYKALQVQKLQQEIKKANETDSTVSPDILTGMLNVYKSTGVVPAFGLSANNPLRAQFYAALGANGNIVNEANTNKSIRAGLSTALKTQQNQLSASETAIKTLDKQLELAKTYSDKVNRSGSPLVNKYLLSVRSGVFGDPETAALNNIVTTASYELAKILSGSAASIAGTTVSSAEEAKQLLNSAMSKGQFNEVLGLMEKEAKFRLDSQRETINQLQKDLNNVGTLTSDLKSATTITKTKSGKPFDYQSAKNAGYTDAEIQSYLNAN